MDRERNQEDDEGVRWGHQGISARFMFVVPQELPRYPTYVGIHESHRINTRTPQHSHQQFLETALGSSWTVRDHHDKKYRSTKNSTGMVCSEIPLPTTLHRANSIERSAVILLDESYGDVAQNDQRRLSTKQQRPTVAGVLRARRGPTVCVGSLGSRPITSTEGG